MPTTAPSALSPEAAKALPRHVAVIMDGNGRWAKSRGLSRIEGHRRGADTVRQVIETAGELGIGYLTLYAFSSENWSRPQKEVDALMNFLSEFIKKETKRLKKNRVRFRTIGQIDRLPQKAQRDIERARAELYECDGLTLIVALSYGSRAEIVQATRAIAEKLHRGEIVSEDITEELVSAHLHTAEFPDPDLLIRTSGEMRISNFLLWQISYAELVITPTLWPDFDRPAFLDCLEEFARRDRRYGGL